MKKLLFISIFFLVVNFVFAQVVPGVYPTKTPRYEIKIIEREKKIEQKPEDIEIKLIQPKLMEFPKGVKPALPKDIETKPITPEIIRPILPDEDRSDDVIVQINNLRITRILLDPGIQNVKAIFFAVRDIGLKLYAF